MARTENKNIEENAMGTYMALASEPIDMDRDSYRGSRLYAARYFERRRMLRRIRQQLRANSSN